jgi:glycerophosphoryl diester phosphodiesterase
MNDLYFRWPALLALLLAGGVGVARSDAPAVRFISHRGESLDAPENTLAAFQLAVDRKTAGFECDIYLTADSEIVCIHDATTTRTTGTNLTVAASTLAQLRALDAGAWKGAQFAGERIPTLAEALALARDGFEIYVEVKCGPEIVPRLAEVLAAEPKATPGRVLFLSFTASVIAALKQQLPAYRSYWLTNTKLNGDGSVTPTAAAAVAAAQACGASGIDAQASAALSPAYVNEVQAAGLSFHIWTVNVASQAVAYAAMGVETISSDCAAALAAHLAAASSETPVLHWTFDGTPANSGGGGPYYDAAFHGSPVYTNGLVGQGLRLDGVDDFVSVPCRLSDQGTISLWYRPDAFFDFNTVFDNPADANKWELWFNKDGRLRFRVNTEGSGDVQFDAANLNGSNQWYHVALTWDKAASNAVLYVNGVARAADAINTWAAPGAAFYLGGGNAGNMKGRGVADEVRVYGAALSAAEVRALHAAAASQAPVVRWAFDGAATNSGTGGARYDAVLNGGPAYAGGVGRADRSLLLDGADDFVSAPYRLPERGTLALWYRPERFYETNTVFDNSSSQNDWKLWIGSGGSVTFQTSRDAYGCAVTYAGLNALNGSNRWYHLAVTWDAAESNTALYVNGQLRATATNATGTAWRTPGTAFYLGGGAAGNSKGLGRAADVRVYEAPLTAAQLRAVFQEQGEVVYLPFDGSAADRAGGDSGTALSGTPTFAKGRIGQAFSALGPGGATNNAAVPYTLTEEGTIALWYYARGPWYNYQAVFDNAVNPDWWELWIYNTGVLAFRIKSDGSGDVRYDLDNLRGPNQWYHIAVTWDRPADVVRLFVDGVERASDPIGAGWVAPGNTLYLGGHTGNTPGSGLWDEVRLFNRALDAEEIPPLMRLPSSGTIMRVQ